MERTQAYSTLRLDPAADGQMVSDAYWRLVRQAQTHAEAEPDRAEQIDRLNEAYTTLSPNGATYAVPARITSPRPIQDAGAPVLDAIADWFAAEALRTRKRWADRNPEIAVLGGAALALTFLALGAGASLIAVFVAAAVGFVAIWSPWRRVD